MQRIPILPVRPMIAYISTAECGHAYGSVGRGLHGRLAFARQKVDEVVMLGHWLNGDRVILNQTPKAVAASRCD